MAVIQRVLLLLLLLRMVMMVMLLRLLVCIGMRVRMLHMHVMHTSACCCIHGSRLGISNGCLSTAIPPIGTTANGRIGAANCRLLRLHGHRSTAHIMMRWHAITWRSTTHVMIAQHGRHSSLIFMLLRPSADKTSGRVRRCR